MRPEAQQDEGVVELRGLGAGFVADGQAQAAGHVIEFNQAFAALVEDAEHGGAGLAENLLREGGLGGAVVVAGELVGHVAEDGAGVAQGAVGVLGLDAHGLESGGCHRPWPC